MSNINSVENARSVVAERHSAKVSTQSESANVSAQSGKVLPEEAAQPVRREAPARPRGAAQAQQKVEAAVEQLNDYVQSLQRDLRFSVDQDLGRTVVHVIDRNSQEVIRQIPNETALRLARNLKDQALQGQDLRDALGNSGLNAQASLGLVNTRI